MQKTIFCHFGSFFCSLPHYWPEKIKFWDNEKMSGRIISLHLCITIDDHVMYISRDAEHDRHNFLSFWTAIYLLKTRKIKILKKWKESSGDVIILHMCSKNHDHIMYASWDIECKRQYFVIWVIFCSLPHYWPENLKLWENGKIPGRIIILNLCITIDDHMIYGSRDTEHDRQNFLSSWTVIYLLTTRKIKILKKWKNFLAKLSFYTCLQLMKITWCAVREIERMTDRIFCHYGSFFVLLISHPPPPHPPIPL